MPMPTEWFSARPQVNELPAPTCVNGMSDGNTEGAPTPLIPLTVELTRVGLLAFTFTAFVADVPETEKPS